MDQIEKFIRKLDSKTALKIILILQNIIQLDLKKYDIEKMSGYKNLFRIRVGKIRIVFRKNREKKQGEPVCIEFRGKVYKNF